MYCLEVCYACRWCCPGGMLCRSYFTSWSSHRSHIDYGKDCILAEPYWIYRLITSFNHGLDISYFDSDDKLRPYESAASSSIWGPVKICSFRSFAHLFSPLPKIKSGATPHTLARLLPSLDWSASSTRTTQFERSCGHYTARLATTLRKEEWLCRVATGNNMESSAEVFKRSVIGNPEGGSILIQHQVTIWGIGAKLRNLNVSLSWFVSILCSIFSNLWTPFSLSASSDVSRSRPSASHSHQVPASSDCRRTISWLCSVIEAMRLWKQSKEYNMRRRKIVTWMI